MGSRGEPDSGGRLSMTCFQKEKGEQSVRGDSRGGLLNDKLRVLQFTLSPRTGGDAKAEKPMQSPRLHRPLSGADLF